MTAYALYVIDMASLFVRDHSLYHISWEEIIMMTWLKEHEVIQINNADKTVTVLCTLNHSDEVYNCMYGTKVHLDYGQYIYNTSQDNLTFVGVARYKTGDKYDVTLATRVAESKMERQFHKFLIRCLKDDISIYTKYLDNLNRLLKKEEKTSEAITSHIKSILNINSD